ncbi:MAG TPA: hypothetical protein VL225_13940 [Vicinamibacterales bacterium]|jgi:hypothetical protein|nr:hypothetical protein [Vicinamibacterales bacterium]
MHDLKPLSREAVPAALAKAERYRLLNEPGEAESICLDVLQVEPGNQEAMVMLILALTDQFPLAPSSSRTAPSRATDLVQQLSDPYDREYYAGIVRERRAKAVLHRDSYASTATAIEWLREAMASYERAEAIRPAHNDDAVLRWNACARLLQQLPHTEQDTREEPIQLE